MINNKPRMPFRVLGLDLIDLADLLSPGPEFARASLSRKGPEMLRLQDRSILTDLALPLGGIEIPPVRDEVRFCRSCAQREPFQIDPRGSWYQCSRCGHYE
jgi:hypothetical protein